jgi:hypothetical protein
MLIQLKEYLKITKTASLISVAAILFPGFDLNRSKKALEPYKNIVFLVPGKDNEETLKFITIIRLKPDLFPFQLQLSHNQA